MVFLADEGSVFDADIGKVWEYIFGGGEHDKVHTTTRRSRMKMASKKPFSLDYSAERSNTGTRWKREKWRITFFPPVSQVIEILDGPLAGSKMVYLYSPKGRKTRIDVYGEFTSKTLPPRRIETVARRLLASEFEADAPAVRAYAAGS